MYQTMGMLAKLKQISRRMCFTYTYNMYDVYALRFILSVLEAMTNHLYKAVFAIVDGRLDLATSTICPTMSSSG